MSMTQQGPGAFASSVVGTAAVEAQGTNGAEGIRGTSDSGDGVRGESSSVGVRGFTLGIHFESGIGVHGESSNGIGVRGSSDSGTGIFGESGSGLAGQFEGNVQVRGNFSVTGNKAFVQAHPTDPNTEIVYVALEGGEAGTYVRGSGQLQSGKAVLALPKHFGLVTASEGLTVQLTPRGEWLQLYVVELDTAQLIVREAQGKSGAFDYLIQGVRRGSEQHEVIRTKR
jgi:hypothetical protein